MRRIPPIWRSGTTSINHEARISRFAVMRRLGFAEAFTNDRHFRAAGFDTLL
ncbi:MAG: hypothetical protein NTU53_24220 [Planctomycetota bacterium]|nr:hypothetical protein [Planctomycetota bacterium]